MSEFFWSNKIKFIKTTIKINLGGTEKKAPVNILLWWEYEYLTRMIYVQKMIFGVRPSYYCLLFLYSLLCAKYYARSYSFVFITIQFLYSLCLLFPYLEISEIEIFLWLCIWWFISYLTSKIIHPFTHLFNK